MSVKQSRNIDSASEGSEIEEVEEFYSEDVKARVAHFNQHASEITQVIDDLISAGCEVMENLKQRFVNRMEGVKEELLSGVQSENQGWGESSKKSKEDLERLISIKELVKSIGISS